MSRIEETLNVKEQGIAMVIVYRTVTRRKVRGHIKLRTGLHYVEEEFYERNSKTRDQEFYDAIGDWMAKH